MNNSIGKLKKCISLAILLVLIALPGTAFAAAGSLQIALKQGNIQISLYPVADANGILTEDFADLGIPADRMLAEKYGRKNALMLRQHALNKDLTGDGRTTDSNGVTHYTNLEKGIYLITYTGEQNAPFDPFLVKIPTVINGEEQYYLKATPKSLSPGSPSHNEPEDPEVPTTDIPDPEVPITPETPQDPAKPVPEPEVPNHTLEMDDPIIPQTGATRYPIWLLNGFGSLCILAGVFQLKKSSREEDFDEEDFDEEA